MSRKLDLASGGSLLLLAILLTLAGTAWRIAPLFLHPRVRLAGDGRTPESYGFDLSPLLVPRGQLVASGVAKDGLAALVNPRLMAASEVLVWNRGHRGKYLVPSDRIIGVRLDHEARAYPLRVLNWHEVVNDTLGGVPIAVTYNPLCDSVVVFHRTVGGELLELGVSGLLYNSNLLMFDRRTGGRGESLWSQLQARAIAGRAAAEGRRLQSLPFSLARWDEWVARFGETTVLAPDPAEVERYSRDAYGTYFESERLRFPVAPLPPEGMLPGKLRVLVVGPSGRRSVYRFEDAPERYRWPEQGAGEIIHAFWFAWYATHPDDPGTLVESAAATAGH